MGQATASCVGPCGAPNGAREETVVTIPMAAPVACVDGYVGDATQLVIDPVAHRVTHLVAREAGLAGAEHVAPVALVAEASPELVRLRCTRGAFAALPPYKDSAYSRGTIPAPPSVAIAVRPFIPTEATWIPVQVERVPRASWPCTGGWPWRRATVRWAGWTS
jgi:hypothetical protein